MSFIVTILKKPKVTCLIDCYPLALTPTDSKCFKRLIRDYICSVLPVSLDPLQFTTALVRMPSPYTLLSPTWTKTTCLWEMFVDSAFNTIVLYKIDIKLQAMGWTSTHDELSGRIHAVENWHNHLLPIDPQFWKPTGLWPQPSPFTPTIVWPQCHLQMTQQW